MSPPRDPFAWTAALREPQQVLAWDLAQWEWTIRLARRLRLLGRLAEAVDGAGLLPRVPPEAARHLLAEQRYARWRIGALRWALDRVGVAWANLDVPKVLLKGAAYVGQDLALGRGRLPSDVDVLVPKAALDAARQRLVEAGWSEMALDAHDQRYYRDWTHELPPFRHPVHTLELDLHHDILPPVARVRVDITRLLARVQPAPALPGWSVFAPDDQVLHAAAHLFHDSDLRDRLRDLVDIDQLLRLHAAADAGWWPRLVARGAELGLAQSLALALALCARWLDTPVPHGALQQALRAGLPGLQRAWLPQLMAQVLHPTDPDALPSVRQRWADKAVLGRYHLGRMPLRLLVPHLWHKARSVEQPA